MTTAMTASPQTGSGRPRTATSGHGGVGEDQVLDLGGAMFSPPEMISSFFRSTMK